MRRSERPVKATCTCCGSNEHCWPEHKKDFVCLDCYTEKEQDEKEICKYCMRPEEDCECSDFDVSADIGDR